MITDGGNWYVASSNHGKMREMTCKMCCDIFPSSIELSLSFIFLFFRPLCEKNISVPSAASACCVLAAHAKKLTSIQALAQQVMSFYSYRWNDYETRGITRVHPVLLHVSQCSCFVILHLIKTPILSLYSYKIPQRTFFKYEALLARWHPSNPLPIKKSLPHYPNGFMGCAFYCTSGYTRPLFLTTQGEKKKTWGNHFFWGTNKKGLKCGRTVAGLVFFNNHFYLFR